MRQTQAASRKQLLPASLIVFLALVSSQCGVSEEMAMAPFAADPRGVETSRLWVERGAQACISSVDAQVELCLPALSLDQSQEVSLTRIFDDATIGVGPRYILGPQDLTLRRMARWRIKAPSFPLASRLGDVDAVAQDPSLLRVAHLSQTGPSELWRILEKPQNAVDARLGRSDQVGTFAVVDPSYVATYGDSPFSSTSEADVLLADGQFDEARAAYSAVLGNDPQNSRAHLGRALCRILTLSDSPPVRDLLTRCELNPLTADLLFGSTGYTETLAQDLKGDMQIELGYSALTQTVVAETVVTRPGVKALSVLAEERDSNDGTWHLRVDIDLNQAGSNFVVGHSFAASEFPGHISWSGPSHSYQSVAGSSGTVQVEAAGRAEGQNLRLRFVNFSLVDDEGQPIRLSGLIDDTVHNTPSPNHLLFRTPAEAGPPYRKPFVRLLEACDDSVNAPYLFNQARALTDLLGDIAQDLRVVLAAAIAGDIGPSLQPSLPSFLLRSDQDLSLNTRDLRLMLAFIDSMGAVMDVLEPYFVVGYDANQQPLAIRDFVDEQSLFYCDPENPNACTLSPNASYPDDSEAPPQRQERALSAGLLSEDLQRNFLRSDISDLSAALAPARESLGQALASLLDALQQESTVPGLFDLDSYAVSDFVSALTRFLQATQASLPDQAIAQDLTDNPGYAIQLWRLFSDPPEHQNLAASLGQALMFEILTPESATLGDAFLPQLHASEALRRALLGQFMDLPALGLAGQDCVDDAACGGPGLSCDFAQGLCADDGLSCHSDTDCVDVQACLGQCLRNPVDVVSDVAVERAWSQDKPALLTPMLWQMVGPLVQAFPKPGLNLWPF